MLFQARSYDQLWRLRTHAPRFATTLFQQLRTALPVQFVTLLIVPHPLSIHFFVVLDLRRSVALLLLFRDRGYDFLFFCDLPIQVLHSLPGKRRCFSFRQFLRILKRFLHLRFLLNYLEDIFQALFDRGSVRQTLQVLRIVRQKGRVVCFAVDVFVGALYGFPLRFKSHCAATAGLTGLRFFCSSRAWLRCGDRCLCSDDAATCCDRRDRRMMPRPRFE